MSGRHLVAAWDPTRAADTMGAHAEILLRQARRFRAGDADEDDVFVWWGKIRSPNRLQPLPHLADVLALDGELGGDEGPEREVHLYLTDYRSLYVAHVGEVTADDVREEDPEHVPAFYDADVGCDCWFRLLDLRRVVHDDLEGVVRELRRLGNVRHHGKPVSLYGGMVELPLIVTRDDGMRWFDRRARDRFADGRFWVEFDAEQAGVGQVEATLRDDLLGPDAWTELDPAARTFVATAEKIFRDHRTDAAFDFSPVVVNLAKAYEVQLARLLGGLAARVAPDAWRVNVDGRTVHLLDDGPFGLGTLARAMGEEERLHHLL